MIKIKTNNGHTEVEGKGIAPELYVDACVIVKSIYNAFKEKGGLLAETFKNECIKGKVFEDDEDEDVEEKSEANDLKSVLDELDELIKQLGQLGVKPND